MERLIVGVSGASGIVLAHRLIEVLVECDFHIELVMTRAAAFTAREEMGEHLGTAERFMQSFSEKQQNQITSHKMHDFHAGIASGSYPVYGMVVIPCSMGTLSAIAMGLSDNLLRRAADVTLKERRPLVVVPRETPLTEGHLENMLRITRMGGIILPPVPAWYTQPKTLKDIENFIVGRCCDLLKIKTSLYPRWMGGGIILGEK